MGLYPGTREQREMKNTIRRSTVGFTLVELLMVMVVLAVIAAIVIPKFADRHKQSQEASLKSDLNLLRNAIASFQADTGYYPKALADLSAAAAPAQGYDSAAALQSITATDWHGPYVTSVPNDPVAAAAFSYSVAAGTVGNVTSSATGNGQDGKAYSTY